jgi:hypothetical protein
MHKRTLPRLAAAVCVIAALVTPASVEANEFVGALHSMMAELRSESLRDARTIKAQYEPLMDTAMFMNRGDLEAALELDELALLPGHPEDLNIVLRLDGANPIAEKDLRNQGLYLGARPATLGLLYQIAGRVTSGPIEITSLVRHLDYQRALAGSNGNARTDVPTHAMGLAFDIALVNTPLDRAYEIRNVLRDLRDAGLLYFIGESHQLVFHVVPRPLWLDYYDALQWVAAVAPAPPALPAPDIAALMQKPIPPPAVY